MNTGESVSYPHNAKQITVVELFLTCSACPSQWYGKTDQGEDVYIRLRHGSFTVEIDSVDVLYGRLIGYDGIMSTEEMIEYLNASPNIRIQVHPKDVEYRSP